MKAIESIGKRYSRLTVIKIIGRTVAHQTIVLCECQCGNKWKGLLDCVKRGSTKSCGCFGRENPSHLQHGFTHTRFYGIYTAMRARCTNPNVKSFKHYGGRGIKCLWNSFEEFKKDMYKLYLVHQIKHGESQTTLDRRNNSGNYCKDNCRWATYKEQGTNRRDCRYFTIHGITKSLPVWAKELKVNPRSVVRRIDKHNWSIEQAFDIVKPPSRNSGSKLR